MSAQLPRVDSASARMPDLLPTTATAIPAMLTIPSQSDAQSCMEDSSLHVISRVFRYLINKQYRQPDMTKSAQNFSSEVLSSGWA